VSFTVEPLSREHDRADFDSGEPALDEFLRRNARQNQEKNVSRTYVAVRRGERKVLGFYTLASGAVGFESLPDDVRRRLPRYPVPVVHLARLAVDRSVRGLGLGEALLFDALRRAARVADVLGVFAVEVAAKHERAREFYLRYGFRPMEDDRLHLYLPIETIRRLG
jgi:GNAT superfamily N-acetyltransferase